MEPLSVLFLRSGAVIGTFFQGAGFEGAVIGTFFEVPPPLSVMAVALRGMMWAFMIPKNAKPNSRNNYKKLFLKKNMLEEPKPFFLS